MPIIPPKLLNTTTLATVLAILSSVSLYRELFRGGLSATTAKMRKASLMFLNPRTQLRLCRIVALPEIRPVLEAAPGLAFKYLGDYLGNSFSRGDRLSVLLHHYAFFKERVRGDFFRAIVDGRILLWEHRPVDTVYRIWLTFPSTTHTEGDLALILQSDQMDIYTLSFSLGPGSVAGLPAKPTIYIARLQGKGKGFGLIRQATKEMLEVSPAALLLAATEGIATALNVVDLIGVSGADQLSAIRESRPNAMLSAYDDFWTSMGAELVNAHLYRLPVPLPEKPIEQIQRKHRSRALRKRAFKHEVSAAVQAKFRSDALRPEPAVSAPPNAANTTLQLQQLA